MSIEATLNERGNTYGSFASVANLSQTLQRIMGDSPNWAALSDDKREALQTIASKVARILNGDPNHMDSWHDISGYATLVENRIRESQQLRQSEWDKAEQRIENIAASAGDGEHYDTAVLSIPEGVTIPEGMQFISVHHNGQAAAHVNRPALVSDGADLCWHPRGENKYLKGFEGAPFGLYEFFGEHWLMIEGAV